MNGLIRFEWKKIFSRRLSRAAVLFLVVFSVFWNLSTYLNMYAFDGAGREGRGREAVEIDREIARKYEGVLTDEKVQEIMADFAPKSDLHGLNAAYLYGNVMQSAIFARFSDPDGNWNGRRVSDVFGTEEIRIGYTYGWLKTSDGMVRIGMVLSLAVIAIIAPVFSAEYGGVDQIILTSRYGKTKCAAAKVAAGLLSTLLLTALVLAVHIGTALALYGKSGLACSILCAPVGYIDGYIPFNITCGTLIRYQILLAFTGAASVAGITLMLSALCRKQMTVFVISAAVYFFPVALPVSETSPFFRYIALWPLYHAQFVSLMSVERMHNGLLYAVYAVPVATVTAGIGSVVSSRVFARHQVSG